MKPEVTRWFDRTQQDQMVAAHLLENFRPIPIEIICDHCQQANAGLG